MNPFFFAYYIRGYCCIYFYFCNDFSLDSYIEQNYIIRCVKCFCIRSYSSLYFSAFGLNTTKYEVSLRIQSECEKIWTRIIQTLFTQWSCSSIWFTPDFFFRPISVGLPKWSTPQNRYMACWTNQILKLISLSLLRI